MYNLSMPDLVNGILFLYFISTVCMVITLGVLWFHQYKEHELKNKVIPILYK